MAAVHTKAISEYEYDFEKEAYDMGAEQAAAAADEEDGMIPGNAGEEVSIEEIAQIVTAMVQSGELDPQLAEAILAELTGGAGGAGGGEEAMMEDPAMAEEMKAASEELAKAAAIYNEANS